MIGIRTIGTFAILIAFGLGFSEIVEEADQMRSERTVTHEVRTLS